MASKRPTTAISASKASTNSRLLPSADALAISLIIANSGPEMFNVCKRALRSYSTSRRASPPGSPASIGARLGDFKGRVTSVDAVVTFLSVGRVATIILCAAFFGRFDDRDILSDVGIVWIV